MHSTQPKHLGNSGSGTHGLSGPHETLSHLSVSFSVYFYMCEMEITYHCTLTEVSGQLVPVKFSSTM